MSPQVVDYKAHPQLSKYLSEQYSETPFDAIIDNAGVDDSLYLDCPQYLTADGTYLPGGKMDVTHGGGGVLNILAFVVTAQLRRVWPVFFGGVPRRYVFVSGNIDQDTMKHLPPLVEDRKLQGLVDSVWAMEDAIQVGDPNFCGEAVLTSSGLRACRNPEGARKGRHSRARRVIAGAL
jgi:hypothetical protein